MIRFAFIATILASPAYADPASDQAAALVRFQECTNVVKAARPNDGSAEHEKRHWKANHEWLKTCLKTGSSNMPAVVTAP